MPLEDGIDTAASTPTRTESPTDSQVAGKKRKAPTGISRGVASLTPEQLAKKRANDREAQRAIRERTKSQIENLERRIHELESQQPYQELQAVIRQKQAIQEENDEIRRRLASVLAILQPIVGAQGLTELATAAQNSYPQPPRITQPPDQTSYNQQEQQTSSPIVRLQGEVPSATPNARRHWLIHGNGSEQSYSPGRSQEYHRGNPRPEDTGGSGERLALGFLVDGHQQTARIPSLQQSTLSQPPTPTSAHFARSPSQAQSTTTSSELPLWATHIRNTAATCPLDTIYLDFLSDRRREASQGVPPERLIGPPIPSYAALLNPELGVYSHPISKVMTGILSTFPDLAELTVQVAHLCMMHMLMRWQVHPTKESYEALPEWLRPLPCQLIIPHPPWMDHVYWPQMRETLIANYKAYPIDNFFIPYTTTVGVNWPYDPRETLLSPSSPTEDGEAPEMRLKINPVFERHIRDINNWSIGPGFVKAHPELVDGVRISEPKAKHAPR